MAKALESLRRPGRAKSILAFLIFGIIILVFALFGLTPDMGGPSLGGSAAVVNSKPIPISDFRQRLQMLEEQMQNQSPGGDRESQFRALRARVMDELVYQELLAQAARQEGFQVSDKAIREVILGIEAFKEDGRFRRERYEAYLRYYGQAPSDFEERVRKDLMARRAHDLFVGAMRRFPGEAERDERLRKYQLTALYLELQRDALEKVLPVAQGEVDEGLMNEARQYFTANRIQFSQPERVRAQHILIAAQDKRTEAEALARLEEVKKELETASFEKVATKWSDDEASKMSGGDLGLFPRGRMVSEFDQVAFSLPVGELSPPVKTSFGYHLIKVNEKVAATSPEFEDVQSEVISQVRAKRKVDLFLSQLEGAVSSGDVKQLEALAQTAKVSWQKTGDFDFSSDFVPKLGEQERLMVDILRQGEQGGLIPKVVRSQERYWVVRVEPWKVRSEKAPLLDTMAQFQMMRRSGEVFDSWLQELMKGASITRNPQLL